MNPKNAEAIQEEQRNQNKAGYTFKKYFMEDLSPNLPIITFHVSGLLRSEYLCPVPPRPQVMRKSWCPRMVSEGESSGSWWDHEGGALLTGTPAPVRDPAELLAPSTTWGHSKKAMAMNQEEGPPWNMPCCCLPSYFPASRTVRCTLLLFIRSSRCGTWLLQQPKQNRTWPTHSNRKAEVTKMDLKTKWANTHEIQIQGEV